MHGPAWDEAALADLDRRIAAEAAPDVRPATVGVPTPDAWTRIVSAIAEKLPAPRDAIGNAYPDGTARNRRLALEIIGNLNLHGFVVALGWAGSTPLTEDEQKRLDQGWERDIHWYHPTLRPRPRPPVL